MQQVLNEHLGLDVGSPQEVEPLTDGAHSGDPRWRSVFAPEQKRVINGIPIMLNVMLPWMLFCVTLCIWSFRFHFHHGNKLPFVQAALVLICCIPLYMLYRSRVETKDPHWYGYTFVTFCLAVGLGVHLGESNYNTNMWFYYKYDSMEAYPMVDVGKELGVNVLDAGRVYFSSDSHIDSSKSWHFKDGTTYCVAPIVTGNMLTDTLDFWAVGTDCCAATSADFRCGEFSNPRSRSGLRYLDEAALVNYRLAVQQAAALFHLHATNPLFFTWTQDPLGTVMTFQQNGFDQFCVYVLFSLALSVFCGFMATVRFSFIGREPLKEKDEGEV